jgi:hypothetical protein
MVFLRCLQRVKLVTNTQLNARRSIYVVTHATNRRRLTKPQMPNCDSTLYGLNPELISIQSTLASCIKNKDFSQAVHLWNDVKNITPNVELLSSFSNISCQVNDANLANAIVQMAHDFNLMVCLYYTRSR